MTGAELAALKARVKTVQSSNCGAPLDLQHDTACRYRGSPISILDPDAVSKTIQQLGTAQARMQTVDVEHLANALMTPPDPVAPHVVGDLVMAGLAVVATLSLRADWSALSRGRREA